jgi:hypothetical protein
VSRHANLLAPATKVRFFFRDSGLRGLNAAGPLLDRSGRHSDSLAPVK